MDYLVCVKARVKLESKGKSTKYDLKRVASIRSYVKTQNLKLKIFICRIILKRNTSEECKRKRFYRRFIYLTDL